MQIDGLRSAVYLEQQDSCLSSYSFRTRISLLGFTIDALGCFFLPHDSEKHFSGLCLSIFHLETCQFDAGTGVLR